MKNRRSVDALAVLVLTGSVVGFFFVANPLPPTPDRALQRAIGETLAREALRVVKPGVGVVVLRRDTEAFRHPESDLVWEGFERVFRAGGGRVAGIQSFQVDPLRPLEVPSGDFYEVIRKSPEGSGVVSLMGPPRLSPEQLGRLGRIAPAVVAFCPGSIPRRTDLSAMLRSGLLQAAVVERDERTSPRGVAGGGFESRYRVLRPGEDAGGSPP